MVYCSLNYFVKHTFNVWQNNAYVYRMYISANNELRRHLRYWHRYQ